jgi:hypothetical protein
MKLFHEGTKIHEEHEDCFAKQVFGLTKSVFVFFVDLRVSVI